MSEPTPVSDPEEQKLVKDTDPDLSLSGFQFVGLLIFFALLFSSST